jgi:hypothetical protein
VLGANPTYTCSIGYVTDTYDYYSGGSSYLQIQNSSLYIKATATNKWAWYPASCTSSYSTICEVPAWKFLCPPAPPPMPPSPPNADDVDLCLPADNDVTHCWGSACYHYLTSRNYTSAKQQCANISATVFSPSSHAEQLEVESYFAKTKALTTYWLGVEKAGNK